MKIRKKILILLCITFIATGCTRQPSNDEASYTIFCFGSCLRDVNSDCHCVWRYLLWQLWY